MGMKSKVSSAEQRQHRAVLAAAGFQLHIHHGLHAALLLHLN
jgi:hypothetical protein